MEISRKRSLLPLLVVFVAMLAAFNFGTARMIASGKAGRIIHRDTIVHGDGARLYAYLRSIWFDGDFNTANELEHYFNYPGSREPVEIITTSTGYAWNHTPVGCALLWSPFFLLGHATAVRMSGSGTGIAVDGYSPPYTLAIAIGTHVYCFLGIILLFLVCSRYFSTFASLLAVLTTWLASFLPAYLFLYPSMSHAQSFFSVSFFIWLWLKVRESGRVPHWCLLGAAAGLMALVRTQNAIFLCVPILGALGGAGQIPPARRFSGMLLMGACALIVFSPQIYLWKVTYGSCLTIPQGAGFLHWARPAVRGVLFSPRHGLLSWTPALILGFAGLPGFLKRERLFGLTLLMALILQLYLNSIVDDWWAGTGFGARRFDNCLPILALGMAASYEWMRARGTGWLAVILTAGFIAWNGLFTCQYALNWVSHTDPINMARMAGNQARMLFYIISRIRSI